MGIGNEAIKFGKDIISGGIKTIGGMGEARSEYETAQINAAFAELQALDALKRGDDEAAKFGIGLRSLVSKQKTSLAAGGIQLGVGTPAEIIGQTYELGSEDMAKIRVNAARDAFGYTMQASNERGKAAKASAKENAALYSGILTGGLQTLNFAKSQDSSTPSYGGK